MSRKKAFTHTFYTGEKCNANQMVLVVLLAVLVPVEKEGEKNKIKMRWPGVEPGSIAWKATMLTVTPPTLPAYTSQKSAHTFSHT